MASDGLPDSEQAGPSYTLSGPRHGVKYIEMYLNANANTLENVKCKCKCKYTKT